MDSEEFVKRLDAVRAAAALKRIQALEALAQNVDLRHENGDAFTSERARQLRKDRQVSMRPDPLDATDP